MKRTKTNKTLDRAKLMSRINLLNHLENEPPARPRQPRKKPKKT